MFEEIRRLANNIKKLDVNRLLTQILTQEEFQRFILELNQRDQLFEGIDALGVELDGYSFETERMLEEEGENRFSFGGKSKSKKAGQPIFLFDTGEFYESFKVIVNNGDILITANGLKEDGTDLLVGHGKDVLGLTEENTQKLIDKLREKLIPQILQQITC